MQCYCDDDTLRAGIKLDSRDHRTLDLTDGRPSLGDQLLDLLVGGMLDAHSAGCAPDGSRWAELRESTVKKKGHGQIGIATGKTRLLEPYTWTSLAHRVTAREAWIEFPRQDPRWGQVHGWQNGHSLTHVPARKLLGWTRAAQAGAQQLVAAAHFAAD